MRDVNDFVTKVFAEDQIDRTEFLLRGRQSIAQTLEQYLPPVIKLTKEELVAKTGFSQLISDLSEDYRLYSFPRFAEDNAEFLVLHAPKKVEIHHVVQQSRLPVTTTVAPKLQTRQPRSSHGAQRQRKRGFQSSVGGLVPDDDEMSLAKKFRSDVLSDDDDVPHSAEDMRGHPENLKEVISGVFQEFWDMDYGGNDKVEAAFFARIDRTNCLDYGLTDFAPISCSLPVIKDTISGDRYNSMESFYYDFTFMFKTILQFFPADHPAHIKAMQLYDHFEKRWAEAKALIRYR